MTCAQIECRRPRVAAETSRKPAAAARTMPAAAAFRRSNAPSPLLPAHLCSSARLPTHLEPAHPSTSRSLTKFRCRCSAVDLSVAARLLCAAGAVCDRGCNKRSDAGATRNSSQRTLPGRQSSWSGRHRRASASVARARPPHWRQRNERLGTPRTHKRDTRSDSAPVLSPHLRQIAQKHRSALLLQLWLSRRAVPCRRPVVAVTVVARRCPPTRRRQQPPIMRKSARI